MKKSIVIIITGAPAVGKTTLARRLAKVLSLPMISKDGIKELLFDDLGFDDREWAIKLNKPAYTILKSLTSDYISSGVPFIIESNFMPHFENKFFQKLKNENEVDFIQVFCKADAETILARFRKRVEMGERHPGHGDHLQNNLDKLVEKIENNSHTFLDVESEKLELDLNDFSRFDEEKFFQEIKNLLQKYGQ